MSLLIISSPSAWGKTTLKDELVRRWWKSALSFTTRKPRSEREKDEYVFLTKRQFFDKLENWDFLEHTQFNWENYGVSKTLPEGNVVIVLDPVGRNQVMEQYARTGERLHTLYLDISPELQLERLEERRMSVIDIKARQKDFDWMSPTKFCMEMDWDEDVALIADEVEESIFSNTQQ